MAMHTDPAQTLPWPWALRAAGYDFLLRERCGKPGTRGESFMGDYQSLHSHYVPSGASEASSDNAYYR